MSHVTGHDVEAMWLNCVVVLAGGLAESLF